MFCPGELSDDEENLLDAARSVHSARGTYPSLVPFLKTLLLLLSQSQFDEVHFSWYLQNKHALIHSGRNWSPFLLPSQLRIYCFSNQQYKIKYDFMIDIIHLEEVSNV